jgi:hypothetical protein
MEKTWFDIISSLYITVSVLSNFDIFLSFVWAFTVTVIGGSLVTTAWRVLSFRMKVNVLQLWKEAVNTLNK